MYLYVDEISIHSLSRHINIGTLMIVNAAEPSINYYTIGEVPSRGSEVCSIEF